LDSGAAHLQRMIGTACHWATCIVAREVHCPLQRKACAGRLSNTWWLAGLNPKGRDRRNL